MANLPHTQSFKISYEMREWLRQLAKNENRKIGDMIRILLGRLMEINYESKKR